ncbi:acyl-CoA dehydrogenase family protein [Corticimicrobacter populi]|uniref:Monooxygenase n=1 Tax=Corticimicrobacter populi TaxID=2175229 RepID=A0A2V1K1M2_9BURK|nr:acyl-CoA dehydrogenase family protein [Corticimicrobacter populi]PWF21912.1 monooxygenase [Corticimicrobacter populi]
MAPTSVHPAPASSDYDVPGGTPEFISQELARQFAATAAARDEAGGTPQAERDALRRSGLLALSIPRQYGGLGADWAQVLDSVRQIATADSSVAHVYGFQHLLLATVRLFGQPEQWEPWWEQTARNHWFWGNTLNPLDTRTVATRHDGWWSFSGKKSFCSGATDSQMLVASALDSESGRLLIAALPTGRAGITLNQDWNNIGQRQTDSGSALFEKVRVEQAELLLNPGPLSTPFSSLRPLLAQLIFVHMFLGISEGALAQAREYTLSEAHPWFKSGVERASQDPHVLTRYGEFWAARESVRALAAEAAQRFDEAWRQGETLTAEARGRLAIAVSTAKVVAVRAGLDITSGLFEVTGARATHGALRLDRFWRNLRTQSLHDPLHYKVQELGEWALNDSAPTPSFYS